MLPYMDFSVRVPERDLDALEEILSAISPAEIRRLQRGVKRYYKYFYWDEGSAYELVVMSLTHKVEALGAHFRH